MTRGVRKTAIISGRMKLIHDEKTGDYALFDLELDPAELRDVASEQPEVYTQLQTLLHARMQRVRENALRGELRDLSDEERAMLHELGYLEDEPSATTEPR